jgi:Mg2+/citrate symporter
LIAPSLLWEASGDADDAMHGRKTAQKMQLLCLPATAPLLKLHHSHQTPMDRQERHRHRKEKEREQDKKDEKAFEEATQDSRPPFRPVWLWILGVVLTLAIVYAWTVLIY